MNERLKQIRKAVGLNQKEFSQKINIAQSSLAMLETGQRFLKDIHISQICTVFNVNEMWLRTGEGDMFVENDDSIISELAKDYNLDDFDKTMITHYLQLDSAARKAIKDYVAALATQLAQNETAATIEENNEEVDIEAELERYRQELEAEKKAKMLSASPEQKKSG